MLKASQPPNMALQRTRRPSLRSGRSLRSLGSPLNAYPLGGHEAAGLPSAHQQAALVTVIALMVFSSEAVGESKQTPCPAIIVTRDVARLVKPILKRPRSATYWRQFDALLDNGTPPADEALAVLLRFYIGEDPGGDVQCQIIHRGKRMLPLLRRYRACGTITGVGAVPVDLTRVPDLYPEIIDAIQKGEDCDPG